MKAEGTTEASGCRDQAVIRPGWPPERGGWALSGALFPRKTKF